MAAELKPLGSAAPGDPTKASLTARIAGKSAPKPNGKKIQVYRGASKLGRWVKILAYGHTGSGKSRAIIDFLKAGLRVVVITTDFGGSGLSTVFNELMDELASNLITRDQYDHWLSNLVHMDLESYEQVNEFLDDPAKVYFDALGEDLYRDFDPDFVVWDGFSAYQQVHLAKYIGDMTPAGKEGKNVSEGREAGLQFEQQDWGMIRNGTLQPLNKFLSLHNKVTGKAYHKYVTMQEDSAKTNKLTNETARGPMLQGAARSLIEPAFDIILRMHSTALEGAKDPGARKYVYQCIGTDNIVAKSRGYKLGAAEEANMTKVWAKIAERLGGPATVVLDDKETA